MFGRVSGRLTLALTLTLIVFDCVWQRLAPLMPSDWALILTDIVIARKRLTLTDSVFPSDSDSDSVTDALTR